MLAGTRDRRLHGSSATPAELAVSQDDVAALRSERAACTRPARHCRDSKNRNVNGRVREKAAFGRPGAVRTASRPAGWRLALRILEHTRLSSFLSVLWLFPGTLSSRVASLYFECLITIVSTFEDEQLPGAHRPTLLKLYLGRLRHPSFTERTKSLYSLTEHFKSVHPLVVRIIGAKRRRSHCAAWRRSASPL